MQDLNVSNDFEVMMFSVVFITRHRIIVAKVDDAHILLDVRQGDLERVFFHYFLTKNLQL